MRALLSKNQNRQIDIVDYLVQANGWVHIDELAKHFKVSTRAIKKGPRLGAKAFEQAAGFLRIPESDNVLVNTGVHPESYPAVEKLFN